MKLANQSCVAMTDKDQVSMPCKIYQVAFVVCAILAVALSLFVLPSFAEAMPVPQDETVTVPDATRPRPTQFSRPAIIEFKGQIDRKLKIYFDNRFAAAKKAKADLLIIEIDSPGGLRNESLEMSRKLRDCDWAYTVALISNEAISGGALVALGCDEIMIDPNATLGDIGEIEFNQMTGQFRAIEPKLNSYLVVNARAIAESKGRSPELAEAFVDRNVLVYAQPNPDAKQGESKLKFTSVRAEEPVKPDAPWKLVPESRAERYLTLTGLRAAELELAQGHEHSRELAATEFEFDLNQAHVYHPTMTDSVVHVLNNPFVTGLLVLLGLVALYFELSAPGISIGGLLAGLCAVLFFWSRFLGGTAGWLEVILFLAGIVFLFTEVFVLPGFGFPGITGLALLFSSVILAGQDFVFPQTAEQWNQSLTSMLILICSGLGFIAAAIFISKRMGSLPIFNRMILAPRPVDSDNPKGKDGVGKDGMPKPETHPVVSVGEFGKAESLLRPAGRARFGGRSVDVVSDGSFVESGTQVRVIRIKGNIITVSAVSDSEVETENRIED